MKVIIHTKIENFIFLIHLINADTIPKNLPQILEKLSNWNNEDDLKNVDAIACTVLPFENEMDKKDKIFYFCMNNYFQFLNIIGIGMGRGECQIIKKSMFIKVKGYNDKIVAGEDFDLYRRIAKVGKVKFLKDFVAFELAATFEGYKDQTVYKDLKYIDPSNTTIYERHEGK